MGDVSHTHFGDGGEYGVDGVGDMTHLGEYPLDRDSFTFECVFRFFLLAHPTVRFLSKYSSFIAVCVPFHILPSCISVLSAPFVLPSF